MENTTEETSNNAEAVETSQKSQHVIAGAALLLVVLIILFVVFKPADEVSAPMIDENQVEEVATTTASSTNGVGTTSVPQAGAEVTQTTNENGEQVIVGDGYIATVRPVAKQTPVIEEFSTRLSATGETCFYSWKVSMAQTCSLITGMSSGIQDVGTEGSLQIAPGTYILRCSGLGGTSVNSEALKCEV
jgi:hypothetical protein